jgi:integrase
VLRWQDADGKWNQESCGTGDGKAAAELCKWKFNQLNGLLPPEPKPEPPKLAWDDFAKADIDILTAKQRAGATVTETQRSLDHFKRICSPATPLDVTVAMVEQFVIERVRDAGAATVNKDLRTCKAAFNRAIRREVLERNPFAKVEELTTPEKVKRVLTENELTKLVADLRVRDKTVTAAVFVAIATGMRIGELANLQWGDVALDTGDLHITNKLGWRTKSKRNRYEWLPDFVRDALRPLKAKAWQGYVFADRKPDQWYFHARKIFDAAVEATKIPRCTFHDLRETALTGMANGGAGVWVLQRIAGHSSPKVTEEHYVDVHRSAVRAVISQHGERLKVAMGA